MAIAVRPLFSYEASIGTTRFSLFENKKQTMKQSDFLEKDHERMLWVSDTFNISFADIFLKKNT